MLLRSIIIIAIVTPLTATAGWTTIGARGPTTWTPGDTYPYTSANASLNLKIKCTTIAGEGENVQIAAVRYDGVAFPVNCDGTEVTMGIGGAGSGNIPIKVYGTPQVEETTSVLIEGTAYAGTTDVVRATIGPLTITGTPGSACNVDVQQSVGFTLKRGATSAAEITRRNASTTGTLALTIKPSDTDGTQGLLLNDDGATLGYSVEQNAMTAGAYVTSDADNSVSIAVPADAALGTYRGTATVTAACQ